MAEKSNDDPERKSDNSQIISELKSELESLKSETWQFEKFQRNGRRFTYILAHILLLLVPIIQLSFHRNQKLSDIYCWQYPFYRLENQNKYYCSNRKYKAMKNNATIDFDLIDKKIESVKLINDQEIYDVGTNKTESTITKMPLLRSGLQKLQKRKLPKPQFRIRIS